MTGHESDGRLDRRRLPDEDVDVINSASDIDTSHLDSCHVGVFPADSYHDDNSNDDASFIDTELQEESARSQNKAEYFLSISNCQIYDVRDSDLEDTPPNSFESLDNVMLLHKKWDWLLLFVVIFAVVSTYALIWAKGLGILELTKGDLKVYFAGWLSPMMALVFHRLYRSPRKRSRVG